MCFHSNASRARSCMFDSVLAVHARNNIRGTTVLAPVKLCSCFFGKLCLQMMYKVAAHILIIPVRLPQGQLCLLFPLSRLDTLRLCAQLNLRKCGRCLIVSFAVVFPGWDFQQSCESI